MCRTARLRFDEHGTIRTMRDEIDTGNPELRASDTERERVAVALREHAQQGRLDVDELSERLDRVYAARTLGELAPLTADLPAPSRRSAKREQARAEFRGHLVSYVLVNLLLIGIWAASGAGYFWPIWPIMGWGIGIGFHAAEAFGTGRRMGMGCGGHQRRRTARV